MCGKLMSRQILTRFDPEKKSAVLREKLASVRQPFKLPIAGHVLCIPETRDIVRSWLL